MVLLFFFTDLQIIFTLPKDFFCCFALFFFGYYNYGLWVGIYTNAGLVRLFIFLNGNFFYTWLWLYLDEHCIILIFWIYLCVNTFNINGLRLEIIMRLKTVIVAVYILRFDGSSHNHFVEGNCETLHKRI